MIYHSVFTVHFKTCIRTCLFFYYFPPCCPLSVLFCWLCYNTGAILNNEKLCLYHCNVQAVLTGRSTRSGFDLAWFCCLFRATLYLQSLLWKKKFVTFFTSPFSELSWAWWYCLDLVGWSLSFTAVPQFGHAVLTQVRSMCSWTVPCASSLVPSVLHLSRCFLRRKAATDKLVEKIVKHDSWPIQPGILNQQLLRLTSRKPLWLDLQPVDIKSRWRHNWKSAQVVSSHLVCDPTIQLPGFDLPQQQWSLLNCFRTEQGHCDACRRKWRLTDTDLCPCGETQTMFHIVESCPPDKTEWRLISATLFRWWRCFVADHLWHAY